MALREEELELLFETIDAMIDARFALTNVGGNEMEYTRAEELKTECVNLIAYGEERK